MVNMILVYEMFFVQLFSVQITPKKKWMSFVFRSCSVVFERTFACSVCFFYSLWFSLSSMSSIFRREKIFFVLSQARKKTNDLQQKFKFSSRTSANQFQSNSICSRFSPFRLLQINIEWFQL